MSEFDPLSVERNDEEIERQGFSSSRRVSSLLENSNDYFTESKGHDCFRRHQLRRYSTEPLLLHKATIGDDEDKQQEEDKEIAKAAFVATAPQMPSSVGHLGGRDRALSTEEDSALQTLTQRFYSESSSSVVGGASSTGEESIQTISCSDLNLGDIFSCSSHRVSLFSTVSSSTASSPAIDAFSSLGTHAKSASSATEGTTANRRKATNDDDQRGGSPRFSPCELRLLSSRSFSMPKLWATSTDVGRLSGTTYYPQGAQEEETPSIISQPTVLKISETKQLVIFTMERRHRQTPSNDYSDDISVSATANRFSSSRQILSRH